MKIKIIVCLLFFVYAGSALAFTEDLLNNYFGLYAGGTGGSGNAFFGGDTGGNTVGNNNTFMGFWAGGSNTGDSNTFIGTSAGMNNTGENNTFLGVGAGTEQTNGSYNTFLGVSSGASSTGSYNAFVGYSAGYSNTGGDYNTFVGNQAGYNNSADTNTFIGNSAGYSNTSGFYNMFSGSNAGYSNQTGIENTFIGVASGYNTTGSNNVFLGFKAGIYETGSNKLYIDSSSTTTPLIYGEFDSDFVEINGDLYVTGNTYFTSDKQLKKDIEPIESSLEKILGIKGVSYKWKNQNSEGGQSSNRHYGVIAQQIEKILPEIVDNRHSDNKRVAYMELIPVMIEAMKEQQETITKLSEKVHNLERELELKDTMVMADIN